jgi:hypothetical protein
VQQSSVLKRPDGDAGEIGAAAWSRLADTDAELGALARAVRAERGQRAHHHLPAALLAAERGWGALADVNLKRLLFVLMRDFDTAFAASGLPPVTRSYFIDAFHRIAAQWTDADRKARLSSNAYVKDLGICSLRLVPAAARVLDPLAAFPASFLPTLGAAGALRAAAYLAGCGGNRPFVGFHVHDLQRDYFSEAGWRECLHICGALLKAEPRLRGLLGGSWFYDPNVARISPHLAYLTRGPAAGGALLVRGRSTEETRSLATKASRQRAAAAESGDYTPEHWWLIWARRSFLASRPGHG